MHRLKTRETFLKVKEIDAITGVSTRIREMASLQPTEREQRQDKNSMPEKLIEAAGYYSKRRILRYHDKKKLDADSKPPASSCADTMTMNELGGRNTGNISATQYEEFRIDTRAHAFETNSTRPDRTRKIKTADYYKGNSTKKALRVRSRGVSEKVITASNSDLMLKSATIKKRTLSHIRAAELATKTAAKAEQVTRMGLKASARAAKLFADATAATLKLLMKAAQSLAVALAAGGSGLMLILLVILLFASILYSCIGIFFSNDGDVPNAMTNAVAELNTEFSDEIKKIRKQNPADVVEIEADDRYTAIKWNDVLSIYAVKTTTDPIFGMEVVTMDENKKNMLRDLMWEMNSITHSMHTTQKTITVIELDDEGKKIESIKTIYETTLTITITHVSAEQMARAYHFDADQLEQLDLLMSDEFSAEWAGLIGAFTPGNGDIIISDIVSKGFLSWPLKSGGNITSYFGYRSDPFTGETKYHGALDIAAAMGTPILAAADGVVSVANATDSWGGGYGYYVRISHSGGYDTLYGHCSSISVVQGQSVKKGQVISAMGSTGNSTGSHVHWEVYLNGARIDPLAFF
ncbi:MAG: M23 family metallopeptidase [Oscillospiraceae bacterium]